MERFPDSSKRLVLVLSLLAFFPLSGLPLTGWAQSTSRPATAPSATVRPAQIQVVSRELPNGLKMAMVEDHRTPIVSVQVWYHVGSKDERPGRTGFAHLFEHLMFKGSTHVKPDEYSKIIEAMGGV